MLLNLSVRDFALVDELDVAFSAGLNVITGESGAGKSILLGALGLVLGERAATSSIRAGAPQTSVTAELDLTGSPGARAFLADNALRDPDAPGLCVVRRVVTREGRSRAFINGTSVNVGDLAAFAALLIDIHGQNDHQRLLQRDTQLTLLDDYGAPSELIASVAGEHRAWQRCREAAQTLSTRIDAARDRRELLTYQTEELDALALGEDEYARLDIEHRRLASAEDTEQRLAAALEALTGDDGNAVDGAGHVLAELRRIRDDHPRLGAARELLENAVAYLDDAGRELRGYGGALERDPERFAELERRLAEVTDLARKHRVAPEALAGHHAALVAELNGLSVDEAELDRLHAAAREHEARFREAATRLSKARQRAAKAFAADVSACLGKLGMAAAALHVALEPRTSERGLETADYRITTSPDYPPAPLAKIASGGERSRIALAVTVVAARKSALPALVLDEADVGVGGTTADVLGRMLRDLAGHTQVLCVTHAPQIAALGRTHYRVVRTADHDTVLEPLDRGARVSELARMLGGARITDKTRSYAETLMAEAAN